MTTPETRIRRGTAFLLLVILVLGVFVVLTQRKQARLRAALAQFQRRAHGKIYVDRIGLSEADKSMASTVKRPPSDQRLTLREHLNRVLKPLGLGFVVRDRFLMITSEEARDESPNDDPYLGYRYVLR
jgi:hypothetical protein